MRRAVLGVLLALLVVAAPITGPVMLAGAAEEAGNADSLPDRWAKTVGGGDDDKLATGLKVDGGYLVVGWSNSSAEDGKHDGYVAMLDRSGQTKWNRTYGGPGTDRLFGVEQVEDGYLLVGMETETTGGTWDGWVMKIGPEGEMQWEQTHGTDGPDAFWSLARSGDSIFVGGWQKDPRGEAWTMELNTDGTEVWSQTYDTPRSGADEFINSIFVTGQGDLLLTGTIEGSTFDPADGWVLKVDSDEGEVKWDKAYGGTEFDHVHDAIATDDGGFVLAGRTASKGSGEQDGWLFKIRSDGKKQWERTYGTKRMDAFFGVHDDPDGGYLLSGTKHVLGEEGADGWVVKTDDRGHQQWENTYGQNYWDKFWPVVEGHGGGYLAIGESTSYGDNRDGWLVRIGGPAVAAIQDADENESGTTVLLDGSPVRAVTLSDSNVSGVLAVAEETNLTALSPPGDPVYAVTMDGGDALENASATVEFTVRTDAVETKVSDLRVVQQTEDGWAVRETTVVSEANGTAVLAAEVTGPGTLAVTAVEAPTASIDATDVATAGKSVELSAAGSTAENGSVASYEWTVAGTSYSGETTSVTIDEPGEYAVNLTVTDENGLRDEATATLLVNDRPEATVQAPDSVTVGKAGSFSAEVSDEMGDVTVTWTFGDATVTGESVEHSFGSPGTKTVEVVVEDEYGATVTEEVQVQVEAQSDPGGTDETTTTATPDDDNDGAIPGFGVGAALVALLAAALLARRARA